MRRLAWMLVLSLAGCAATPQKNASPPAPPIVIHPREPDSLVLIPVTGPCNDVDVMECVRLAREQERLTENQSRGAFVSSVYNHVVSKLDRACTRGNLTACAEVGHMYLIGLGAAVDQLHAVELFRLACVGDEAEGCMLLGRAYLEGITMPPDTAHAVTLLTMACERKNAEACYRLAELYMSGAVVRRDVPRAAELFSDACDHGSAIGCARRTRSPGVTSVGPRWK